MYLTPLIHVQSKINVDFIVQVTCTIAANIDIMIALSLLIV